MKSVSNTRKQDTGLKNWTTVRSKLYRIGQEEGTTFKGRVQQLWEYCEPVSTHKREIYFLHEGAKCRMQVYKGAWKTSSKNEIMTMGSKSKKGSKNYWYVEIEECVTKKQKNWEKVTKVRVDERGRKSELLWVAKGKTISGKKSSKLAHAIYKALKPRETFLHDDAHITFGYAGGKKAVRERARRKSHYKKKMANKRRFRPKKGMRKKQRICIRVIRALCKGEAWYESFGFRPIKRSGHKFAVDSKNAFSQHPAQYYAAIDRLREMTVNEIADIFDESTSNSDSKLAENARELVTQLGFKRANVTLGTLCNAALGAVRRNPKSLRAQALFAKFNNTFLQDHENRFDWPTSKLEKYYGDLNTLELTMIFTKKRKDFETWEYY